MEKCKNCEHKIEQVKNNYNHVSSKKHTGKILSFPCHFCNCNNPELKGELKSETNLM